ncbi:MAG: selenium-dependent xanthine dehydrogenase, partial [Deltaproteobacteria bacterium]|nr:selenium-dependent xanthine dehydrogenase [Deltaproteobacteria bacterium]
MRQVEIDAERSLLSVLRDDFDLISPKNGCEPMGQCGCCTVLIDGKPRLSCTLKAASVAGKLVTTLEGLPGKTRDQIGNCFVHAGGVQCGFCIPGIAMRAHALCDKNASATRDEIAHELRAHLCRCTGYTKIVDAVELLGSVRRGEPMPANGCIGKVGEP